MNAKELTTGWPADWLRSGYNGVLQQAARALRYLAENDRPIGGEQFPNSASCHMLANELNRTRPVFQAAVAAALSPAPPGWRLVPSHLTDEMIQARQASCVYVSAADRAEDADILREVWVDLLAAAPQPPEAGA